MNSRRAVGHLNACLLMAMAGVALASALRAQSVYENYTFTTFAGLPETGPGSEDGLASAARFNSLAGITVDAAGNLYIADSNNHTIRKVSLSGVVTTVAGLAGSAGSADGTGGTARFNHPQDVTMVSGGNLLVADTDNHAIRMITPAGLVSTFAGLTGTSGSADGAMSEARFTTPLSVAVDKSNTVYVVDTGNQTIRAISAAGVVRTVAGSVGLMGTNDGIGSVARFNYPQDAVVDGSGNLFVADGGNHTIRKVTPAGAVTTFAGSAGTPGSVNGIGTAAQFDSPCGLAFDSSSNLFVADTYNQLIRKITPARVVTTVSGTAGPAGYADGTGAAVRFNYPLGLVFRDSKTISVADTYNHVLRQIASSGAVTTPAGLALAPGSTNGTGSAARFFYPQDVALDTNGNIYVADDGNATIRKITPGGVVTNLAGLAGSTGTTDGRGSAARFNHPAGLTVDHAGIVYVADAYNHTIRKITPDGTVTTLAGYPGISGTNNGTGTKARFNTPLRVAVDGAGFLYVGDTQNHAIRKITPAGQVTTLAGTIGTSGKADGVGTNASFSFPEGVAVDSDGNVFVADDGNDTIRKITSAGQVSTLAGTPGTAGSTDGAGSVALFNYPFGLTLDADGNVYVTDSGNQILRKVTPAGIVTTLAGTPGVGGNSDETGPAALFSSPTGLAIDSAGDLYLADAGNHTIRKGIRPLPDYPVVDRPVGPIGTLRNLDVTNLTTTSWSWRIVRYPATSSIQLSSTDIRNPTLTPDVDDVFVIRFTGTDASGRVAPGAVIIDTDSTPPVLTIDSPLPGQLLTKAWMMVQGTAIDDRGVAGVWCQVNESAWFRALTSNNWTNWTAGFGLAAGTNMLRAYAQDLTGNISATNSIAIVSPDAFSLRLSIQPSAGSGPGPLDISLEASVGASGRVEFSPDLFAWSTLTSFVMTNSIIHFSGGPPTGSRLFYRAIVP